MFRSNMFTLAATWIYKQTKQNEKPNRKALKGHCEDFRSTPSYRVEIESVTSPLQRRAETSLWPVLEAFLGCQSESLYGSICILFVNQHLVPLFCFARWTQCPLRTAIVIGWCFHEGFVCFHSAQVQKNQPWSKKDIHIPCNKQAEKCKFWCKLFARKTHPVCRGLYSR